MRINKLIYKPRIPNAIVLAFGVELLRWEIGYRQEKTSIWNDDEEVLTCYPHIQHIISFGCFYLIAQHRGRLNHDKG